MKELTLNLTVEEVNQILDALGTKPFKEVFELIGKIQNQAAQQLNGQQQQQPNEIKEDSDG